MAEVARPSFYEGQVLSAADLDLGQEYGRAALSRHERYLHTPGIATGLELRVDESTGAVQVRLSAGMAIDATGRQIVVDREETLSPEELDSQGVLIPADTDPAVKQDDRPWHPVFLSARDESATPPSFTRGCGSNAQPNRTNESYAISFGFPGEEAGNGTVAEISDGPQPSASARVLIGYVQWDGATNFAKAEAMPPNNPPTPYAGVRADEVVARSGALAIRADLGQTRAKRPALVMDGENGGEMRFGLQDDKGKVVKVFSVDAAGNLFLSGAITGPIGKNSMWAESGTVFDGMLIPLPAGVPQDQVAAGQIVLHVTVSPRRTADLRPPGVSTGTFIKEAFECRVEGRRAFVRDRWFSVSSLATLAAPTLVPAACDYVIVASTAGSTS
jgi:hypothetical protein